MIGPCRDILECYGNDVVSGEGGIATEVPRVAAPAAVPVAEAIESADAPASAIVAVQIADGNGNEKNCFAHGDEIQIRIDVEFRQANAAPCLGIHIRTVDDITLWAATTALIHRALSPTPAGSRIRYVWKLAANMGGNRFVVALGVGDVATGEYRRHHRLNYAGHFDVLPEPASGGGWLALAPRFEQEG